MRTADLSVNSAGQSRSAALWLRRATLAGSLSFFVKGLVWLAAGYWLLAR